MVDVRTEGHTDRWVDIETGFIRWTQRSQSLNQSENSLSIYASDKVYMWLYDITYWDKYGSWEDDQEGDLKAEQEQLWTSS